MQIAYWAGVSGELIIDTEVLGVTVNEVVRADVMRTYPIGSLVLLGIDYSANEIIWIAASSEPLDSVPDRLEVAELVLELLSTFPIE